MMKYFRFHMGIFTSLEEPPDLKKEGDWLEILKAAGYSRIASYGGNIDEAPVEVFQHKDTGAFLVHINLSYDKTLGIFLCDDVVDLIEFTPFMLRWMELEKINYDPPVLESIAKKAFEAWHGHQWYQSCHECDRDDATAEAYRRSVREAKRLAQRQEEK